MFEFKVVERLPKGQAIEQLMVKGYVDPYRALSQLIRLIGVELSRNSRNSRNIVSA